MSFGIAKQATTGAAVTGWGCYNLSMLDTAATVLGLVSVIVGIIVGLLAVHNAIKTSRRLDAELAALQRTDDG